MFDQTGIRSVANSAQEDQVQIILVGDDLEIIARQDVATGAYRFRNDELAALPDISCHRSMIIILSTDSQFGSFSGGVDALADADRQRGVSQVNANWLLEPR